MAACPPESDPSFNLWHNNGACVDMTAQVRKLHRLRIPLARFENDRWGREYLVGCAEQHCLCFRFVHGEACSFENGYIGDHHLRKVFR